MQLKDIAINNLRRRKSKMMFLIFGMVFAITTIVALFSITSAMQKEVAKKYNEVGTKLVITPNNNARTISYGGITVPNSKVVYNIKELKNSAINEIKNITDASQIQVIAPKVLGIVEINGKRVTIAGVDFASEMKIKSYWKVAGQVPTRDDEIIIGSDVAVKIKKQIGDTIQIKGNTFKIVGTLDETGTEEDKLIFGLLTGMQKAYNKAGILSFIEVSVDRSKGVAESITREIKEKLPDAKVSSPQKVVEQRKEMVDRFAKFSMIISLVMLIIGVLIVMTTMMTSVNERIREIGIFRAIGFRQSHVMKIIFLEAGLVCGISGIIGYITGLVIALFVAPIVAQMKVSVSVNPLLALTVILLSILIGLAATYYPASKAAKLDPAESLRYI